jgi:hypothetical protein
MGDTRTRTQILEEHARLRSITAEKRQKLSGMIRPSVLLDSFALIDQLEAAAQQEVLFRLRVGLLDLDGTPRTLPLDPDEVQCGRCGTIDLRSRGAPVGEGGAWICQRCIDFLAAREADDFKWDER